MHLFLQRSREVCFQSLLHIEQEYLFSTDKETATLASQASKIIQSRNILLIDVSLCQKQKSQSNLKSQAALLIFTKLFIVAFIYFLSYFIP